MTGLTFGDIVNRSIALSGSIRSSRSDNGIVAEFGGDLAVGTVVVIVGRRCGLCVMLVAAEPAELLSSIRELKGEKLTLARSHEGLTLYDSLLSCLHLN